LTEALGGAWSAGRVAEEVKGLDQNGARPRWRKYGVRFGAYHLYLPNFAQARGGGAPRAAALGRSRRTTPDTKGLDEVAASGLVRADILSGRQGTVPKALYRVVGYRVLRRRARGGAVDILERLRRISSVGHRLAPGFARRQACPARSRAAGFNRDRQYDVADRLIG